MAIDEAILECHSEGLVWDTLHFYIRSSPVVSLGYFQKVSESIDLAECNRRGVHVIRRRSGGSSIYTDPGQLIYGLVVSGSELPPTTDRSFEVVCSALSRAIARFGVEASYRPVNDIEVGGRKVSGSAQLRKKGSVLQHGTVLLDTDLEAMDAVLVPAASGSGAKVPPSDRVTTLNRIANPCPSMAGLKRSIVDEMSHAFSAEFEESGLTAKEAELVERYVSEKYAREEWNMKY